MSSSMAIQFKQTMIWILLLVQPGTMLFADNSEESVSQSEAGVEVMECDPVVSVRANNKMRFDILKELADEHNFELSILESENKRMSMEKDQNLSKVIESITRDMSVVLNFQKQDGCDRLVEIAVLDNEEWVHSSSGVSNYRSGVSGNRERYSPKFKAPVLRKNKALTSEEEEKAEAQRAVQKERRAKRLERKKMRSWNDDVEGGDELKADYNIPAEGDSWKKNNSDREEIPDMEQYVQEVLDGDRKANMRNMSLKQRSEYMRIRRQLRSR